MGPWRASQMLEPSWASVFCCLAWKRVIVVCCDSCSSTIAVETVQRGASMHTQIEYVEACGKVGRIHGLFFNVSLISYFHVFPYTPWSWPEVVKSSSLLANEAAETSRTATGIGTPGDPGPTLLKINRWSQTYRPFRGRNLGRELAAGGVGDVGMRWRCWQT